MTQVPSSTDNFARQKKPLPNGWVCLPSKSYPERVYYFNTITRCSTWENPCEEPSQTQARLLRSSRNVKDSTTEQSGQTAKSQEHSNLRDIRKRSLLDRHFSPIRDSTRVSSEDDSMQIDLNNDIEDYDDHDEYLKTNPFSFLHFNTDTPPKSPTSSSSISGDMNRANIPKSKIIPSSQPKQLWTHFVTSASSATGKRSLVLSDLESEPKKKVKTELSEVNNQSNKIVRRSRILENLNVKPVEKTNPVSKIKEPASKIVSDSISKLSDFSPRRRNSKIVDKDASKSVADILKRKRRSRKHKKSSSTLNPVRGGSRDEGVFSPIKKSFSSSSSVRNSVSPRAGGAQTHAQSRLTEMRRKSDEIQNMQSNKAFTDVDGVEGKDSSKTPAQSRLTEFRRKSVEKARKAFTDVNPVAEKGSRQGQSRQQRTPPQSRSAESRKRNAESRNEKSKLAFTHGSPRKDIRIPLISPQPRLMEIRKKKEELINTEKSKRPFADVNAISEKSTSKTPAQTRLVEFRKKTEEIQTKEISRRLFVEGNTFGVKGLEKDGDCSISPLQGVCNSSRINTGRGSLGFGDQEKRSEFSTSQFVGTSSFASCASSLEMTRNEDEEMEWEPFEEKQMINHIIDIRKTLPKEKELSSDIAVDRENKFRTESSTSFLVPDTNVLISCLSFVKEIQDAKIAELGFPIIYIPWRVLQELDHLKDSKERTQLASSAKKAIDYINRNIISGHPRFKGQSFQDFSSMIALRSEGSDDEILTTCIHLMETEKDKKVVLVTNDKNLESKALSSRVPAFSKDRFLKEMVGSVGNHFDASVVTEPSSVLSKNDNIMCGLKDILRKLLIVVVETELMVAYGEDWKKLVKEESWTLENLIQSFIRFWRSVFHLVFPRGALTELENLKKLLKDCNRGKSEELLLVVESSKQFVGYLKRNTEIRSYVDLLESSLEALDGLVKPDNSSSSNSSQINASVNLSGSYSSALGQNNNSLDLIVPKTEPPDFDEYVATFENQVHVDLVKSIFRDIWNFIRNFWISASEVIAKENAGNQCEVQTLANIKTELPLVCSGLRELIFALEKVMFLVVSDITQQNPAISHLSSLLYKFATSINVDLRGTAPDDLPKKVTTFCLDPSERQVLSQSLNDFQEFFKELLKAMEYFESRGQTVSG